MKLFRSRKKVRDLHQQSAELIRIFEETATKLQEVNQAIDAEVESINVQVQDLEAKRKALEETKARNGRISARIREMLQ